MQIDVLTALNRGIVQAEINSLTKSVNSLAVIKFNIDNLSTLTFNDTFHIEKLFQVIQEALNFNKFIYLEDTFFLFLRDKKIHEASEIANRIEKRVNSCKIEDGSLITNFEITELYKDDTVDTLINRFKNPENANSEIKKENKLQKAEEFKEIIEIFHKIYETDKSIKVHNFYKGVNIFRAVNIVSVAHNGLVFETNHIRAMILKKEIFTFIKHNLFSKVVKANIASVDLDKNFIYLRDFEYLESSPVARKAMRVIPKEPIDVKVSALDNRVIFHGEIVDLSIKSLSIKVNQAKIKLNINENIKVKFIVPNISHKGQLIIARAVFFSARGNNVILSIYPNQLLKAKLDEYITLRQKELVKELKEEIEH